MKKIVGLAWLTLAAQSFGWVATFDGQPLAPQSFWNGSDASGGFSNAVLFFRNDYNPAWGSWSGFALSNVNDTNTPGFANQYAVFSGTGVGHTGAYAVVYDDAWNEADIITLPLPALVEGFYANNTTYAALTMRNGDDWGFSKAFGGVSGDDPDWFCLTIQGRDAAGADLGTVTHYLADFRFTNNALDFIQSAWQWVDLRPLGPRVKTLHFTLTSSDTGAWGMNTPAYFALDEINVTYAPAAGLPHSTALHFTNACFAFWATGWTNYEVGAGVSPDFQTPSNALGRPTLDTFDVASLGDRGQITLTFPAPICDGPGEDFAVFENSFSSVQFLEAAWVEVSTDGANFFRFPSHSLHSQPVAFTNAAANAADWQGLAGKYHLGYGTPFDLAALDAPGLDTTRIRFIRIVDIIGDGSCTDSLGNVIYDPYPTTGSAGFDLAGVGVIHFTTECEPASDPAQGPLTLAVQTVSNFVYCMEASDQFANPAWAPVQIITGNHATVYFSDPSQSGTRRFYRITASPAGP